jgi:hypothetical protein
MKWVFLCSSLSQTIMHGFSRPLLNLQRTDTIRYNIVFTWWNGTRTWGHIDHAATQPVCDYGVNANCVIVVHQNNSLAVSHDEIMHMHACRTQLWVGQPSPNFWPMSQCEPSRLPCVPMLQGVDFLPPQLKFGSAGWITTKPLNLWIRMQRWMHAIR